MYLIARQVLFQLHCHTTHVQIAMESALVTLPFPPYVIPFKGPSIFEHNGNKDTFSAVTTDGQKMEFTV